MNALFDQGKLKRQDVSCKTKLNNTKLVEKCQIIRHIEKGMTNKEASEKFGVPKNTISTWMKNKSKLLENLEQSYMIYEKYMILLWKSRLDQRSS